MLAQFQTPSTIVIGAGARRELVPQLHRLHARSVLLVTDAFMVSSGIAPQVVDELQAAGIQVRVFADVQPDPTDKNVLSGLAMLQAAQADVVVAIGGGSPMDAAKVIAVLATNPPPITQYAGYHRIPQPGLPLVLIPTTAGTGSEATRVAVITDTVRDVKMMLLDRHLIATVALVDFELTMSMPPALTAHVGVDTLTHGIEAYVSRKASALTDPIALSCIRLVAEHLETAFHEPTNRVAREAMMTAACQGGMAFSNSSVALVHGMSRPIGAHFHVPHGWSNAVLLPEVTKYSLHAAIERYAAVARTMNLATSTDSDSAAGEALIGHLAALNERLSVGRLRDAAKVAHSEFASRLDAMATAALDSGSPQNNPRVPSHGEIVELYLRAW